MKYKAHIATGTYEFIEIEAEGSRDQIINEYFDLKDDFEKKLKDRKDEGDPFDSKKILDCDPKKLKVIE